MTALTQNQVRKALNYDQLTGSLTHKSGKAAGWVTDRGYVRVSVKGKIYPATKVIWLWMTGIWPEKDVDHRDRNRANNAWSNLRLATRCMNLVNQGLKHNNRSGFKGVTSRGNSHSVKLRVNKEIVSLGSFPSAIEAAIAYDKAATHHHGEFAVTNKSLGLIP